jgi:hypothetical protein
MYPTKRLAMPIGILVAALAILFSLWSCGGGRGDAGQDIEAPPLTLRTYQVGSQVAPELRTILNRVLSRGESRPPAGRAEIGANGMLVVAASDRVLDEIGLMVDEVGRAEHETPPMVTITYWVVIGTPAMETSWSGRLDELAEVLTAVASADGPTGFRLMEKMLIASLSGTRTEGAGSFLHVRRQDTAVLDDHVIADLQLDRATGPGGRISTRVSIPPGRSVVLGQMGFSNNSSGEEPTQTLYYVIRAQVESGSE